MTTTAITPVTANRPCRPGCWPVSRIMEAIVPGPVIGGMARGEDRRVGSVIVLGVFGLGLAPFCPVLEKHVKGRDKEKNATSHLKGRHRNADKAKNRLSKRGKEKKDDDGGQAGPDRDAAAVRLGHAMGRCDKYWGKTDGIDRHKECRKGGDQKCVVHHAPSAASSRSRASIHKVSARLSPSMTSAYFFCQTAISSEELSV